MKSQSVKRWARYFLVLAGAIILFGLVLVALALIVLDDDDYRRMAVWGLEHAAGYRMVAEGPFEVDLSLNPSLTAGQIRFGAVAGGPAPILKSIGNFRVQIDLLQLLLGTLDFKQLQVADVHLVESKGSDARATGGLPKIDLPVLESVHLRNIRLTDAEGRTIFHLNRFELDDVQDSGPLILAGDGMISGTGFEIEGRMGSVDDLLNRDQSVPLDISLNYAELMLSVSGTVSDYEEIAGLNLRIAARQLDLAQLFKILQVDFPSPGHLNFSAVLSGDLEAPRLADFDLTIFKDPWTQISARGQIPDLTNGEGTDISIAAECRDQKLLKAIFPEDWDAVTELTFNGTVRKVLQGYRIEDINARLANIKGLKLDYNGWVGLRKVGELLAVKEVDLNLLLTSPQTEPIRPLLTELIPEIGSVEARGRLVGPIERLALEDLDIIRGGTGPVRAEFRGRIGLIPLPEDEHVQDMDLDVTIQARQSKILSTFYGVPIDEIGHVNITGRIVGATDRFQLEDIEFHSLDENGLETRMSGGLKFFEQDDGEMLGDVKFELEITAPNMGAAEPLLGANLVPTLGPVSAKGFVRGTSDVVAIEDIDITAGSPDKVQVKWQGRVGKFPLGGDDPIAEVQTFGSLEAARSSDFAALFGVELPNIGPVRGSWRETDRRGIYAVDDLKFTAGDDKTFQLNAAGRVDSVIQDNVFVFEGVDIKLDLKATDTHQTSKLLGLELPNLGAVDGRADLGGGWENLILKNLRLAVRSPDGLEIDAEGGVGFINPEKGRPIREIDLKLSARAPNIAALPLEGDWNLPDLGPLLATARIADRDRSVNIENFDFRAGPRHQLLLHLQGSLDSIDRREDMKLTAGFRVDSGPWIERRYQRKPDNSPHFTGKINLSGTDDRIRVDKFQLSTGELGGFTLDSSGTVKAVDGPPEFELHVVSKARDPAEFGSIFGMSLPKMKPLTIDGRYTGTGQEFIFEGETRVGETRFQTVTRQPVDHPRSRLEAKLSSRSVYLDDLGVNPEFTNNEADSSPTGAGTSTKRIFDDKPLHLDTLSANEFLVAIHVDRIIGKDVELGPLDLDVESKDGRLRVGASDMHYHQGQISFEAVLDTTDEKPRVTVKVTAEDMDANEIILYLNKEPTIEGNVNLVLNLQSEGQSRRELAANLSGEFGLAIENGRIRRGVEMIASDALELLYTAPAKDSFTDLNCMAGRLQFEKGVGTIEILYLDTPGIRAQGFGSIDLASETVDVVIRPISKRRLLRPSSPVRIKGPLSNPSVAKIPANEAAILAGQLAVPIVALPARALGILWSVISEDKDENSPCLTDAPLTTESKQSD